MKRLHYKDRLEGFIERLSVTYVHSRDRYGKIPAFWEEGVPDVTPAILDMIAEAVDSKLAFLVNFDENMKVLTIRQVNHQEAQHFKHTTLPYSGFFEESAREDLAYTTREIEEEKSRVELGQLGIDSVMSVKVRLGGTTHILYVCNRRELPLDKVYYTSHEAVLCACIFELSYYNALRERIEKAGNDIKKSREEGSRSALERTTDFYLDIFKTEVSPGGFENPNNNQRYRDWPKDEYIALNIDMKRALLSTPPSRQDSVWGYEYRDSPAKTKAQRLEDFKETLERWFKRLERMDEKNRREYRKTVLSLRRGYDYLLSYTQDKSEEKEIQDKLSELKKWSL